MHIKKVLSIAGSDSGGGAGIQSDIKTITAHACFAMTALSAVTAQNTSRVEAVQAISGEMLEKQIRCCVEDIGVDAVKIGLLPDSATILTVARIVRELPNVPIVLDPVMVASSGNSLVLDETSQLLMEQLFPLASVVTPNFSEAAALSGLQIHSDADVEACSEELMKRKAAAVLLTGGDRGDGSAGDFLLAQSQRRWFRSVAIRTENTHGSGCTLSSAIACNLANGQELAEAVANAKAFVRHALDVFCDVKIGKGHGPVLPFVPLMEGVPC